MMSVQHKSGAAVLRWYPLIQSAANQQPEQAESKGDEALRVTIVTLSGGRVTNATVSIGPKGKPPDLKARTGGDGTYLSPRLGAGRYQIGVVAACYQPWHGTFEIAPDHEQALEIVLKPSPGAIGDASCAAPPKQVDTEVQFSDSTDLKPGGTPGSVDAGGYSSQAQGAKMRAALGELPGSSASSPSTAIGAEWDIFSRGKALLLRGDYTEAIGVFQRGAAQYPRSGQLLLGLGVAYYSTGRYRDAADALSKAVDLNPSDRAAYFFLAQTYDASPVETDAVLSRFESYTKREPQNAAAQYYYGLCLWRSGATGRSPADASRAERALRSAVALDPSLAEAHYQLGVVLAEQNLNAQAITEFERAIALQPELAEAHYHAAQIYRRTGEKDKAQAELAVYDHLRERSASGDQKLNEDARKLLRGAQ
jgi:Flp pilus assembly protein TadD